MLQVNRMNDHSLQYILDQPGSTPSKPAQWQVVRASEASDEHLSFEATATILKSRLSHFYLPKLSRFYIFHSKNKLN